MPKLKQKLSKKQISELKSIIKNSKSSKNEVLRSQTVLMVNKQTEMEIIKTFTGYSRKHSFRLREQYLQKGLCAIIDKRKGKPKELLTNRQKKEIIKIVKSKTPNQCNSYYNSEFWTTGILGEFIEKEYQVKYKSKTSIYLIFRQSKFTYHKPGRIYEKRDEKEVKQWKKETLPIIKKAWENPNTVILTEDEMILSTQTTIQKIWLPQGSYPKIEVSNKRENRSVYGFLNVKEEKCHAFKTKRQNMYITAKILRKVRKIYPKKKILLLWDGAKWHRGSKAQEYIKQDKRINTLYFPRYSPEENPQEHVWKNGRDKVTHNHYIKNIDKTTNQFIKYLNTSKFNYSLLGFSAVS